MPSYFHCIFQTQLSENVKILMAPNHNYFRKFSFYQDYVLFNESGSTALPCATKKRLKNAQIAQPLERQ